MQLEHLLVMCNATNALTILGSPEQPAVDCENKPEMSSEEAPPPSSLSPKRTPPQVSPKPARKERSKSESKAHQNSSGLEKLDKGKDHSSKNYLLKRSGKWFIFFLSSTSICLQRGSEFIASSTRTTSLISYQSGSGRRCSHGKHWKNN